MLVLYLVCLLIFYCMASSYFLNSLSTLLLFLTCEKCHCAYMIWVILGSCEICSYCIKLLAWLCLCDSELFSHAVHHISGRLLLCIHSVIIQLSVLNLPFWRVYKCCMGCQLTLVERHIIISWCKYIFTFVSFCFLIQDDTEKSGFMSFIKYIYILFDTGQFNS